MDLPARTDTAIIGAGHNGLAMSNLLTVAGRDHVVLERREALGGGWQDRWDGFRLVSPNWTTGFPGQPFDGPEPDGFMPRDEIIATVRRYAETVRAPVVTETEVRRLVPRHDGFLVETNAGPIRAGSVVVAAGAFHRPNIPEVASALPARVAQIHSHDYRREADLPPGGVLVVGSGQTGCQLAEELHDAGREVYLSVGTAGRVPRRYRGRDIFRWLEALAFRGAAHGASLPTPEQLPTPAARFAGNPSLSGHKGGHSTDLRAMAGSGIRLVGRIDAVEGERLGLASGLSATLERIDAFFAERFQPLIEKFIAGSGEDCPLDDNEWSSFQPPELDELDLARAGIASVVWTSGFRPDYSWIDAPITDDFGLPRTRHGVSEVPGLYFAGALWQTNQLSATLFGPRVDGHHIAAAMGIKPSADEPGEVEPPA
ncbi:MAG: NAD(P)-binding domain-containing protein [Chloroflexota bacterium]